MTIESIVLWYEQNVNYKITKSFLNFLIKVGIIKEDIDLDFLNLYLLEKNKDDFVLKDGKYKLKNNRIPIVSKFKEEKVDKKENSVIELPVKTIKKETKSKPRKFRIENIGEHHLKLLKW